MKKIRVGILIVLLPTVMSAGLAASFVLNQAALAAGSTSAASSGPQGTSCTGTGSASDSVVGSAGSAGKGFSICAGGDIAICGPKSETIVTDGSCSATHPR